MPAAIRPRVFVYIDGFNLYYGSLRGTPYKWLDVRKLCERLLPADSIEHIWYFTAEPRATPSDPTQAARHREYIRALETLPNLTVKPGFYQLKMTEALQVYPLYQPNPNEPNPANPTVWVWRSEEKGSDVNLATALVIDAAAGRFDAAWVMSNDADLAWPIERVQAEYSLPVGVIKPERPVNYPSAKPRPDSYHLKVAAAHFRRLREPQLAGCQFPLTLTDAAGTITKPAGW